MTTRIVQSFEEWHRPVIAHASRPIIAGLVAIAVSLGAGGYWAATAPISGAAIAPGVVIATGQNQTVQHLEGGIIEAILVKEGDHIDAGQVVIRLSRTAAESNLKRLLDQYGAMRAIEARYLAERDSKTTIEWPAELATRKGDPELDKAVEGQYAEFAARRESLESVVAVYKKQIDATKDMIVGLQAQNRSANEQLELIKEELAGADKLLKKGLIEKTRVLALRRTAAQLIGTQGDTLARIAQAKQSITEIEARIINTRKDWLEKATSQLRDTRLQIADLNGQIKAARDIAERIEIRSPVNGIIVKLYYNTPGGVIAAGQPVLDILPATRALEVEARIKPDDIDVVFPGRAAQLRFTAFHNRTTPSLVGEVSYISADRLVDKVTQQPYYIARIRLSVEKSPELRKLTITAGMPVEVFIETGQRTFLDYTLQPITETFMHAFRES
jgi:HlyD family secretion protein